jgi:hypothetical protein
MTGYPGGNTGVGFKALQLTAKPIDEDRTFFETNGVCIRTDSGDYLIG